MYLEKIDKKLLSFSPDHQFLYVEICSLLDTQEKKFEPEFFQISENLHRELSMMSQMDKKIDLNALLELKLSNFHQNLSAVETKMRDRFIKLESFMSDINVKGQ